MTMTTKDGFALMKKPERLNAAPKARMYLWWGEGQALLLDKSKVANTDIEKALKGKKPVKPYCHGRIGLYDIQGGQEFRVAVSGSPPSKLAKEIKAEAAQHALRGVDVVFEDAVPEEEGAEGEGRQPDVQVQPAPVQAQPQQPPVQAQPNALNPQAAALLKQLKDMDAAYKQALASPVAAAKLKELKAKAAKHLQEGHYDKAATDIANLNTLVQMALKHQTKPAPSSDNSAPTVRDEQQDFAEFAETLRRQKNSSRAKRLGDTLDAVKPDKYFPVGKADAYAKEGLKPGPEFQLFLKALGNFEQLFEDLRKGAHENTFAYDKLVLEMIGHTQAYLDHHARDLTAEQKLDKANQRKHQIASSTMKMLQQYKMKREFESLGKPENWDLKQENQAAALYAKLLFEEGNAPASKLPEGDSGVSGAWWVEATDFQDPKGKKKKKFIFKPSDMEAEIPGFPPGGSAPREVVSKVAIDTIQKQTGLDFNFPETVLVAIDNDKLPDKGTDEQRHEDMARVLKKLGLKVDPVNATTVSQALAAWKQKDDKAFQRVIDAQGAMAKAASAENAIAVQTAAADYVSHVKANVKPPYAQDTRDKLALAEAILKSHKPPQRMGSMQHFNKSGKPLNQQRRDDPELMARIPKEEVQKTALMDLITLNLDRHPGNFLVDEPPAEQGQQSTPRLIPIDHGLTLPSREGLNARRNKLNDNVVAQMPAAQEPFTPEMLKKIEAIDADAVVEGMKQGMGALKELHPNEKLDQKLPEANFELTRRSILFLKHAAPQLTVDEIFDAYSINAEDIFDTPDKEMAQGFDRAVKAARTRTQARRQMNEMQKSESQWKALKTTVQGLGWLNDLGGASFDRWCAMNAKRVHDIYTYKIENPKLRAELDQMLDLLGQPAELLTARKSQTLTEVHKLAAAALKRAGQNLPSADAPPLQAKDVVQALAEMEKELPGAKPADAKRQAEVAAQWVQYQQLGGLKELARLGGDLERASSDPVRIRLEDLTRLKTMEESLLALDEVTPEDLEQNLAGTLAIELEVVMEGMSRLKAHEVVREVNPIYTEALVALNDGRLQDAQPLVVKAGALLKPALEAFDRTARALLGRLQSALEVIDSLPYDSPLRPKLKPRYLDCARLSDEGDHPGCDKLLKALETDLEKVSKVLEKV